MVTLPGMLGKILHDVVVGISHEQVSLLSAEDGSAIVLAAFEKMDKAVFSKQISTLFFGLTEVLGLAGEVPEAPKEPMKQKKKKTKPEDEEESLSPQD